jgi:hypothetical protein
VDGVLDWVLVRWRGAAGGVASVGEARPRKNTAICCGINRRKMLEGAPERGGGDRGEEEARGSLAASEPAGEACRFAVLRRAIPQRPGDELEGKQREKGAKELGYL